MDKITKLKYAAKLAVLIALLIAHQWYTLVTAGIWILAFIMEMRRDFLAMFNVLDEDY